MSEQWPNNRFQRTSPLHGVAPEPGLDTGEWAEIIVSLIDGVVDRLPHTTAEEVRTTLHAFRKQALSACNAELRAHCEQRLEIYLQSTAQLKGAANQYLEPRVKDALGVWFRVMLSSNGYGV